MDGQRSCAIQRTQRMLCDMRDLGVLTVFSTLPAECSNLPSVGPSTSGVVSLAAVEDLQGNEVLDISPQLSDSLGV